MEFKIGDIVARKSYKKDIYFKIEAIEKNEFGQDVMRLRGLDIRLYADALSDDLIQVTGSGIKRYRMQFVKRNNLSLKKIQENKRRPVEKPIMEEGHDFFEIPGRVLHIDGSKEYLNLCLNVYRQLGIPADGEFVPEKDQPALVPELLERYKPDILVLTGHDGIIKSSDSYSSLDNYHNSRYFIEAVKKARLINHDKDQLIIFAGACQSNYEKLLQAGANYASSPLRVLIHALDPVYVVEKVAFTPINSTISVQGAIKNTITGLDGVGGIDTTGKYRQGYPKSPYQ